MSSFSLSSTRKRSFAAFATSDSDGNTVTQPAKKKMKYMSATSHSIMDNFQASVICNGYLRQIRSLCPCSSYYNATIPIKGAIIKYYYTQINPDSRFETQGILIASIPFKRLFRWNQTWEVLIANSQIKFYKMNSHKHSKIGVIARDKYTQLLRIHHYIPSSMSHARYKLKEGQSLAYQWSAYDGATDPYLKDTERLFCVKFMSQN
eukprot:404218_1